MNKTLYLFNGPTHRVRIFSVLVFFLIFGLLPCAEGSTVVAYEKARTTNSFETHQAKPFETDAYVTNGPTYKYMSKADQERYWAVPEEQINPYEIY